MATNDDLIIIPGINAQVMIDGLPAAGYRIASSDPLYKRQDVSAVMASPVTLNQFGLPPDPLFGEVGIYYTFNLLPPIGTTPLYSWPGIRLGVAEPELTTSEWLSEHIPVSFTSSTAVTIAGDRRDVLQVGRRVRLHHVDTSPIRAGTITSRIFDGTITTVTVLMDIFDIQATVVSLTVAMMSPQSSSMPSRRITGLNTTFTTGLFDVPSQKTINIIPVGMVSHRGSAGWVPCQGQAVSRTVFNLLFAVIGTTYGAGNGTTTFNVPNISSSPTHDIFAAFF